MKQSDYFKITTGFHTRSDLSYNIFFSCGFHILRTLKTQRITTKITKNLEFCHIQVMKLWRSSEDCPSWISNIVAYIKKCKKKRSYGFKYYLKKTGAICWRNSFTLENYNSPEIFWNLVTSKKDYTQLCVASNRGSMTNVWDFQGTGHFHLLIFVNLTWKEYTINIHLTLKNGMTTLLLVSVPKEVGWWKKVNWSFRIRTCPIWSFCFVFFLTSAFSLLRMFRQSLDEHRCQRCCKWDFGPECEVD